LMNFDGESEKVYRLFGISKTEIEFVTHYDARPKAIRGKQGGRVRLSPNRLKDLNAHKVRISPTGIVITQND